MNNWFPGISCLHVIFVYISYIEYKGNCRGNIKGKRARNEPDIHETIGRWYFVLIIMLLQSFKVGRALAEVGTPRIEFPIMYPSRGGKIEDIKAAVDDIQGCYSNSIAVLHI
jgi:hypothetical protein